MNLGVFDSVAVSAVLLVVAAGVIVATGPRMVRIADRLADITGLGEAVVGAIAVGAATSLPDIIATLTPAVRGLPDLAVGNALGGVLGQSAFLAVADITYRRANLEHAAASLPNVVYGGLLVGVLGVVAALFHSPPVALFSIHPGTVLLFAAYAYGLRVANETSATPLWRAVETRETRQDVPEESEAESGEMRGLIVRFLILALVLMSAGWVLGRSGETIAAATGLSQTAVGVMLTGLSSSLPELVVSVSAVRAGALTLAVGNVIGGNTFDTLQVGMADVAYREGPIYSAVGPQQSLLAAVGIVVTAVIVLGLLRRERHGLANIGTESVLVLALYGSAVFLIL